MYYLWITYVLRMHYVCIISVILKIDISFLHSINDLVFAIDVTVFCEVKTSDIGTAFILVLLFAPSQYHSSITP
jgi:hypothetical protein